MLCPSFNNNDNLLIEKSTWPISTLKNDCNRDLIVDVPSCDSSCPFSIQGMSDNNDIDNTNESEFCKEFCGIGRPCNEPCKTNNCNNCLSSDDGLPNNVNNQWSRKKCKNYFKETKSLNNNYKLYQNLTERICENNCGKYCKWNTKKGKCKEK